MKVSWQCRAAFDARHFLWPDRGCKMMVKCSENQIIAGSGVSLLFLWKCKNSFGVLMLSGTVISSLFLDISSLLLITRCTKTNHNMDYIDRLRSEKQELLYGFRRMDWAAASTWSGEKRLTVCCCASIFFSVTRTGMVQAVVSGEPKPCFVKPCTHIVLWMLLIKRQKTLQKCKMPVDWHR